MEYNYGGASQLHIAASCRFWPKGLYLFKFDFVQVTCWYGIRHLALHIEGNNLINVSKETPLTLHCGVRPQKALSTQGRPVGCALSSQCCALALQRCPVGHALWIHMAQAPTTVFLACLAPAVSPRSASPAAAVCLARATGYTQRAVAARAPLQIPCATASRARGSRPPTCVDVHAHAHAQAHLHLQYMHTLHVLHVHVHAHAHVHTVCTPCACAAASQTRGRDSPRAAVSAKGGCRACRVRRTTRPPRPRDRLVVGGTSRQGARGYARERRQKGLPCRCRAHAVLMHTRSDIQCTWTPFLCLPFP